MNKLSSGNASFQNILSSGMGTILQPKDYNI